MNITIKRFDGQCMNIVKEMKDMHLHIADLLRVAQDDCKKCLVQYPTNTIFTYLERDDGTVEKYVLGGGPSLIQL
jgi:hypothetical protein